MSAGSGTMTKKPNVSVKLDSDVYRRAKTAAAWFGMDMSEYLASRLAGPIEDDLAAMRREQEAEGQNPPGPKKGRRPKDGGE